MINLDTQSIEKLKSMLDEKRFIHSVGVAEMAEKLAQKYGADTEKAYIAGFLHDCAKNIPQETVLDRCREANIEIHESWLIDTGLVHPYLGEYIAKTEFGVSDTEILEAIRYHTTGHEDMPLLTKIIYLADMIEVNRTIAGVEQMRELAFSDLDEAVLKSLDSTIRHIINRGGVIDCDTVFCRNHLIASKKERNSK